MGRWHIAMACCMLSCLAAWSGEKTAASSGKPGNAQTATVAQLDGYQITEGELYQEMLPENGKAALERLIGRMLIKAELTRQGIEITQADINAAFAEKEEEYLASASGHNRAKSLSEALSTQYGPTAVADYKDKALWLDLAIKRLLAKEISLSDADALKYYMANLERYRQPKRTQVRHILIIPGKRDGKEMKDANGETIVLAPTKADWDDAFKKADELRQRIKQGSDFAEMAKLHSDDAETAAKGGEIGLVFKGSLHDDVVEGEIFRLKEGEVSEAIKTISGYHLFVHGAVEEARDVPFSEIKERVRKDCLEYIKQANTARYLRKLTSQAKQEGRLKVMLGE